MLHDFNLITHHLPDLLSKFILGIYTYGWLIKIYLITNLSLRAFAGTQQLG